MSISSVSRTRLVPPQLANLSLGSYALLLPEGVNELRDGDGVSRDGMEMVIRKMGDGRGDGGERW